MNEITATLILLFLFILRFAVPLGILIGLGYVLRRIQAHWPADTNTA